MVLFGGEFLAPFASRQSTRPTKLGPTVSKSLIPVFMAPRGLSADEKRVRLLEIFHETRDFYQVRYGKPFSESGVGDMSAYTQLKELEKLGPKMKGIVSQTVKELQARLKEAKVKNEAMKHQIADLRSSLEEEVRSRPKSDTRAGLLAKLSSLKKQHAALQNELSAYGNSDPVKVEQLKRALFLAKEASLRWTDNYCSTITHFTRQTGVDAEEVRKYLEIGDDYEDIY
ncbi:hypothetical protein MD484_g3634, partial [Candolleomyces efflorescens]